MTLGEVQWHRDTNFKAFLRALRKCSHVLKSLHATRLQNHSKEPLFKNLTNAKEIRVPAHALRIRTGSQLPHTLLHFWQDSIYLWLVRCCKNTYLNMTSDHDFCIPIRLLKQLFSFTDVWKRGLSISVVCYLPVLWLSFLVVLTKAWSITLLQPFRNFGRINGSFRIITS